MSRINTSAAAASLPDDGVGAEENLDVVRPPTPLHSEVLTRLRDYIVDGHLADGARIPERQLCEMFGISRTPLREALKVLAAEGFVELSLNRGASVRRMSAQNLSELFDVMGGLEATAGRLACEHITDAEIGDIEAAHHEMYGHYMKREMQGYFDCNQRIHRMILAAARNETLAASYISFTERLRRVRFSANLARKRDRWGEAMREHEAMLDALHRRAGGELADILFQHLRNKRDAAIEHLRETGVIDVAPPAAAPLS